jgi:hypothetical protein
VEAAGRFRRWVAEDGVVTGSVGYAFVVEVGLAVGGG